VSKTSAWLPPAAVAVALALSCAQPSPEERVAEMRGNYDAELQNFVVREVPMPGAEPPAGETAAAPPEPAAAEPAEAGEEGIEETVPVQQNIVLDILIRNQNKDANLPGLTLEVAQVGAGGPGPDEPLTWDELLASPHRKASWRIYVDTSTIGRGPGTSVTHTLEDVEGYEPGDGFVVTVRDAVPPGERGEYREFAEAQ